jgi:hypothetical protein
MKTHTVDRNVAATGSSSANNNHTGAFVASHAAGRTAITLACMLLATSLCLHKNAAAQQSSLPSSGQKAMTAEISVSLDKSVDSKKLKSGEEVDGKVATNVQLKDGTVISRGARIVGHVTEAKARSNGDAESALGIVFDQIAMPDGKGLAIKSVVQAVGPSPNAGVNTGGEIGYGGMNETIEKSAASQPSTASIPRLNDQSVGVLGLKNLQLGTDGVLTSSQKTVKLDSGTQMMVQAQIAGS